MENNIGKIVHDELHRLRVPVAEMEKILHTSRQTIYKWSKNLSSPKGKNLEKAIILLSIINRVKDKKG